MQTDRQTDRCEQKHDHAASRVVKRHAAMRAGGTGSPAVGFVTEPAAVLVEARQQID